MTTIPRIGFGIVLTLVVSSAVQAQPQKLVTMGEVLKSKVTFEVDNLDDLVATTAAIRNKVLQTYDVDFEFRIKVETDVLRQYGITKDARGRPFAQRDKSVADALTTLVNKMSPTKTARSLVDPKREIVWLVGKDKETILITVLHSAQLRSLELPSVFREKTQK